ncbi:hypothetical protein ACDQ55_09190 [Chitinophaga sp. 30R24]|uniref:hypothetical protein n=1 Tax=Chitinophaga sp. 30R24 TaxID=3248838 RepID=UPI003B8F71FE
MKYRNPHTTLVLMNGVAVSISDTSGIALLRKKMMAELELSNNRALRIGEEWFNENDLLQFFESLQQPTLLYYHQEIQADAVLTDFLETGQFNGWLMDKALYKDEAFLSFIAPYFEPLFIPAVLQAIKQQQPEMLDQLFSQPVLLDRRRLQDCYNKILHCCLEPLQLLTAYRKHSVYGQQNAVGLRAISQPVAKADGALKELLVKFGIIALVALIIYAGASFYRKRQEKAYIRPDISLLSATPTDPSVKYLLSQLRRPSMARMQSVVNHPLITEPLTGTDVYGPALMKAFRLHTGIENTIPVYGNVWEGRSAWQYLQLRNSLESAGAVILIQLPDSFYSCYVKPHGSIAVPLPLSASRIYFYVGMYWNPEWMADEAMPENSAYRMKGFFLLPVFNSIDFLNNYSIDFTPDSNALPRNGRSFRMELTISEEQRLRLNILSDSLQGILVHTGE